MRKTFLTLGILAAGAMLLLSSCDKKEDGLNIDNKTRNEFMATIQQCEADDNIETKTYTDDGRRVLWRVDDRVSILQGRDVNEEFRVKKIFTEGTSAALEKVSGEVISPTTFDANIAYYPYDADMEYVGDNTNHAISVKIPSTQTYKENSFGEGALPMVAVTKSKSDYDFEFKNLFGFLKLQLKSANEGPLLISNIIIKGNNNEKLSGDATINCSAEGMPTIEFGENASNSITLECNSTIINATTSTDFWIALPPVIFNKGITVEIVIYAANETIIKKTSAPLTIARSKVKPMEVLTFTELPYFTVPDNNFRQYLLGICDKNNDGYISFSEVNDWNKSAENRFFELNGEWSDVYKEYKAKYSSFDGIAYFAITSLSCNHNKLTSLDLSKNTTLTQLNCEANQLASLDVSKNIALTELNCNINQLTSLDLSKNTALAHLYCGGNQLSSLDVSKNIALTELNCSSNQLTSLDLSKNTALAHLYCGGNQLSSLDVSKNIALTELNCSSNQFTSLDLSKNTALTELLCIDNQFTSLDVSKNTNLKILRCNYGQISTLNLNGCTALVYLDCRLNPITTLNLNNCTALVNFFCSNSQITTLNLNDCIALKNLACDNNQLTSLDLSNCTALTILNCSSNQLTSLDLSNCTALKEMECHSNQLTTLDLSSCTSLRNVTCDMYHLETVYLKRGQLIKGINWDTSVDYSDKIVYID